MTPIITKVSIGRQSLETQPFWSVDYVQVDGKVGFLEVQGADSIDAHRLAAQVLGKPRSEWFVH